MKEERCVISECEAGNMRSVGNWNAGRQDAVESAGNVRRRRPWDRLLALGMRKESGIDGILVTVGLCVIALLLCMVMKNSLAGFIETIVKAMTDKAKIILESPL